MKTPNLLLVYDISDDAKRSKIADVCLDYGLDRIQYSAFMGWLLPGKQAELMLKLKNILGKKAGKVQLFPLCAEDYAKRKEILQKETRHGHE
jgi:CRISPR-associated protein Cas2